MGSYKWKSFRSVDKESTNFGYGLRELGVQSGDTVLIFAETRAEWMIAAQGMFKQNIVLATMYATLGEDGIVQGINETEVSTVVTSSELLPKILNVLQKIPLVKNIVYMEDQLRPINLEDFPEWVYFISFKDVVKKGVHSRAGK